MPCLSLTLELKLKAALIRKPKPQLQPWPSTSTPSRIPIGKYTPLQPARSLSEKKVKEVHETILSGLTKSAAMFDTTKTAQFESVRLFRK